jgi:hypothetical protein
VLRDPARLDALLARDGDAAVAARADREGVTELLAWLRPDVAWLDARRRAAVLADSARDEQEIRLFGELHRRGIVAAVMKGGAVARTHYPASWCRPRLDLDLLVGADQRASTFEVLTASGYAQAGRLPGQLVNHQDAFERGLTPGLTHTVDVHWEAINRAIFIQRLPAQDLLARSRPAPWASGLVRQLDPLDTLMLASVHRAAHHPGDASLIWHYDVWLLARALDRPSVDAFCERARRAGVASLCAHELREARACFGDAGGGALGDDVIGSLAAAGAGEPTRHYLSPGRTPLGDALGDLAALPGARARARLVREHLFPPRAFMAATYGGASAAVLPFLYVWRIVSGGLRWIRDAARAR